MIKRFLCAISIFILNLLASDGLFAQIDSTQTKEKKYNTVYTLSFEQGPMFPSGGDVGKALANSTYYNGVDFRVGRRKTDYNDIYNQVYRFPDMGFGAYVSTFHQAAIGNPFALFYYFRIPFQFEFNKRFTFSYLGSLGIASNFKPYNRDNNPTNVFLGSVSNAYVNFKIEAAYHFSPHWSAVAALGFKHFSNGGTQQPNRGINLAPFSVAVNYRPDEYKPFEGKSQLPKFLKYNTLNVAMIAGTNNLDVDKPNQFKAALSVSALRAISYKYRAGIGLDMFYTSGVSGEGNTGPTFSNSVSLAAVGTWEWVLNKNLYIPLAVGFYMKRNPSNGEDNFYYERVGIRYRFDNNVFCGLTVKAHAGTAEFLEWTVGYSLFKDPNKYRK